MKFEKHKTCPKCGSSAQNREWRSREFHIKVGLESNEEIEDAPERMLVECVCGFYWFERPLDYKGD